MSIEYKVNPVKATCMKFEGTEHGLQGINDTCFGICAAFSGCINTYDMNKQCSAMCDAFVEKRKREIYGVGRCDHQAPYRPVIWEQYPRYVPTLLKNGYSPEQAKQECMKLCDANNPNLASECKEKCILDFNAIEVYEKPVEEVVQEEPPRFLFSGAKGESGSNATLLIILLLFISIGFGMFVYSSRGF
jgi:hypothetical protein